MAGRRGVISNAYLPVAEYIAGKYGLRIFQYGNMFKTTGEAIQIPNPPIGLEDKFEDAVLGGVLHEAEHIASSDWKVLEKAKKNKRHNLLNLLEDLRIERNGEVKYPGGRAILQRFNYFIREKVKLKWQEIKAIQARGEKVPLEMRLPGKLFLGMAMTDRLRRYERDEEVYDERWTKLVDQMGDLLDEIDDLPMGKEGTDPLLDLSERVYKRLEELLPPANDEDGDGEPNPEETIDIPMEDGDEETSSSGKESGKGEKEKGKPKFEQDYMGAEEEEEGGTGQGELDEDEEEGGGSVSGTPDDDEADTDDYNDGDSESEEEGRAGEEEDDGREGSLRDTKAKQKENKPHLSDEKMDIDFDDPEFLEQIDPNMFEDPGDKMDVVNDALKEEIEQLIVNHQRHVPWPGVLKHDVLLHPTPSRFDLDFGTAYEDLVNRVSPQVNILKGRLLPVLVSENKGSFLVDQDQGEIDESRLPMVRSGYDRVYRKRIPRRKMNTCIVLLGDASGSMSGEKIEQEKRCFVVYSETCEALHIPHAMLTFTTAGGSIHGHYSSTEEYEETRRVYNRFEPVKHVIIKHWNERLADVRWRIVSIRAEYNNCDPEAIWWSGKFISERKEKRKIIFVMHDGMPNISTGNDSILNNELVIAIQTLEAAGIEVYGIGIHDDSPKLFYRPERVKIIRGDQDIAEVMYLLLHQKLAEG